MSFDNFGLLMGEASTRKFIFDQHQYQLQNYIQSTFTHDDESEMYNIAWNFPGIFKFIIESQMMSQREKWDIVVNHLVDKFKPPLVLCFGDIRSGKTGLIYELIDELKERRPIAGLYISDPPPFMKSIGSPPEADDYSLIVLDEGGIHMSARAAMSTTNKQVSAFLQVRGHRNMGMIVISQHPRFVDINLFRLATALIFKPVPSFAIASKEAELSPTELQSASVIESMIKLIPLKKDRQGWSKEFIFTDFETGFKATNEIPKWYSEKFSKSYRKLIPVQAWALAVKMSKAGNSAKVISKKLAIQGVIWSPEEVDEYSDMTESEFKRLKF